MVGPAQFISSTTAGYGVCMYDVRCTYSMDVLHPPGLTVDASYSGSLTGASPDSIFSYIIILAADWNGYGAIKFSCG